MNITTKFDMGQQVVGIGRASVNRPPVPCSACDDGHVLLRGERYQCPKCNGRKSVQAQASGWIVSAHGTVGMLSIEHLVVRDDGRHWEIDPELGTEFSFVRYMLDTTGIRSGTLWDEPNVFATYAEAQAECDRRNGWTDGQVVS